MTKKVAMAVKTWAAVARQVGAHTSDLEVMEHAYARLELDKALRM